jgi:hypothetical protein
MNTKTEVTCFEPLEFSEPSSVGCLVFLSALSGGSAFFARVFWREISKFSAKEVVVAPWIRQPQTNL